MIPEVRRMFPEPGRVTHHVSPTAFNLLELVYYGRLGG